MSQRPPTTESLYAINISAVWATLKKQHVSFWLICTYLFFEYVRPQSIYPPIDIIPFAQTILVLALVASATEGTLLKVRNPINVLISTYFLVVLLSSVLAYYPSESAKHLPEFVAWLLVYFLIVNIVNTEARFFIFLLSFLLYSFKMSQFGFRSWAGAGFGFRNWGVVGAPGWFHNSGEFGVQLCIFLPLSLYLIVALRRHWGKLKLFFFSLFPITALGSVIATTSRGAFVGTAAALLWMLLKSTVRVRATVLLLCVSIVVFLSMPAQLTERFETAGADKTSLTRLTRWRECIDIMNDHPVLGIGYGNWTAYYSTYPKRATGLELPHNIFLDAGTELGYTGLSLFLLMIIYTFVNNYRTRRAALQSGNRYIYFTAHGLDAALVGFLVSGSFVSVLYYPFFWINLAMTVALNNIATTKSRLPAVEQPSSQASN